MTTSELFEKLSEDDLLVVCYEISQLDSKSYEIKKLFNEWKFSNGFRCLWCDGPENGSAIDHYGRYRRDENGKPIHHSRCPRAV